MVVMGVLLWVGCSCWEQDVFSEGVVFSKETDSFPVAASVFAPEEFVVVESCEYAIAVYSPAVLALVVLPHEVSVSYITPHDVFAIVSVEQESDSSGY